MVVLEYGVFTFFTVSNPLSNSLSISNKWRRIGLDYSVFLFNLSMRFLQMIYYIFVSDMPTVFEVKAEVFSLQQQLCFLVQAFCSDISDIQKTKKILLGKSFIEAHCG